MRIEYALAMSATLLILSILASKTSGKTGIPALLLFLFIGMLAGSEGIGGIYFDNYKLAQSVGVVSLIYILFSGGLSANLSSIRTVAVGGALLSTVGVLVTAGAVGSFSHFVLKFSWVEAFLLGAIVSSTDAAAVFTVLRSKGLGLKNRIKPLLELESGSNDPLAVLLTVSLIAMTKVSHENTVHLVATSFTLQFFLGGLVGLGAGRLSVWLLNQVNLEFEGLYPVLSISVVALVFSVSQLIGGNGFLSVYILGLVLSQNRVVHKRSLVIFHDGMAWLGQIVMFLCLGLLVFPSHLPPLTLPGSILALFLIFFARPVGVFLCLIGQRYSFREKLFISWVGLRGSVPIVLATYPLVADVPGAIKIFNLVFFVVVISVAVQGTTLPWMAKILKVETKDRIPPRYPLEFVPDLKNKNDLVEIEVPEDSSQIGKSIIDLNLPKNILIVLMQRSGETFVPNGSTLLQKGDSLLVLSDATQTPIVKKIVKGF